METFKKACQDIAALGKGYIGATVLGEIFMGICGAGTYKYENGDYVLNYEDCNLLSLVEESSNELESMLKEKNMKIRIDKKGGNLNATCDRMQIKRVIMNLLGNAISYAYNDTTILVELKENNNSITFNATNESAYINPALLDSLFKKYVPQDYAFYVNQLPMEYYINNHGSAKDYKAHLKAYVDTVNPRFLSYDFYAPLGRFPSIKHLYYQQLTIFSDFASDRKLPFWAFALSSGHEFLNGTYYREPTEADIYWQVNTVLAYGAKGLQYFCYQTPAPADRGGQEFYVGKGGSIVNEKGEKTAIFDYVKNMNAYEAFVDHMLMDATKIGVMHHQDVPACYVIEESLESIREAKSLESNDNILVSVFDYKGKTLYYCVNNSVTLDAIFTLTFNKKQNVNIYPMSLQMKTDSISAYSDTLEPGKAVILEIL